jgi:hypothetical protein
MIIKNTSARSIELRDSLGNKYSIVAYGQTTLVDSLWDDNEFRRWVRSRSRDIVVSDIYGLGSTQRLNYSTTPGTTGAATAETDLQTYTMAAGTLGINSVLKIQAAGSLTGANDTKTVKLYFGATVIATLSFAAGDTGDWVANATIINAGSYSAQKIIVSASHNGAVEVTDTYLTATINTVNSVIIKTTGTTTNASDEASSEVLLIETVL